jgi:hypothetical protein
MASEQDPPWTGQSATPYSTSATIRCSTGLIMTLVALAPPPKTPISSAILCRSTDAGSFQAGWRWTNHGDRTPLYKQQQLHFQKMTKEKDTGRGKSGDKVIY